MNYELRIKNTLKKISNFEFRISNFLSVSKKQKGFTLLIAVVISSLLLSIGMAILNSTLKGFELSILVRNSQFAFYAADSGLECALYWDIKGEIFATSTEPVDMSPPVKNCAGSADIRTIWTISNRIANGALTTLRLDFPNSYCAIVAVKKSDSSPYTTIESRGYNTCTSGDPKRVERAIRITYD